MAKDFNKSKNSGGKKNIKASNKNISEKRTGSGRDIKARTGIQVKSGKSKLASAKKHKENIEEEYFGKKSIVDKDATKLTRNKIDGDVGNYRKDSKATDIGISKGKSPLKSYRRDTLKSAGKESRPEKGVEKKKKSFKEFRQKGDKEKKGTDNYSKERRVITKPERQAPSSERSQKSSYKPGSTPKQPFGKKNRKEEPEKYFATKQKEADDNKQVFSSPVSSKKNIVKKAGNNIPDFSDAHFVKKNISKNPLKKNSKEKIVRPFAEKRKSENNDLTELRSPDFKARRIYGKQEITKKKNPVISAKKEFAIEPDGKIRLNRFISNAGICSRRDADIMIAEGLIRVNGEVITELGYKVNSSDSVKYGNKILKREKFVYILLNKPKDFITTMDDPEERKTVMDLIKNACKERVYPVGRLDRNTTGLLLLTNDGELSATLTHPSYEVKKIYQVDLDKPLKEEDLERIISGIELEDGPVAVDDIEIVSPDRKIIGLEIHEGRNRIVRRIFEYLGYEVVQLDRVMYAGLTKKDLPRGKWRFLTDKERIRFKYFKK